MVKLTRSGVNMILRLDYKRIVVRHPARNICQGPPRTKSLLFGAIHDFMQGDISSKYSGQRTTRKRLKSPDQVSNYRPLSFRDRNALSEY
jgi:hypothetical protein